MNIIDLKFDNFYTLTLSLNVFALITAVILYMVGVWIVRQIGGNLNNKSVVIDEVKLGIGNSEVRMHYDQRDREIAYKIWIELTTRKLGMMFDEENDVIYEVYNSWYESFKSIRELLKEIPAEHLTNSSSLIKVTSSVLNSGLRPHLTKWQAKYRDWYENNSDKNKDPQLRQKDYPEYDILVKELKESNEKIMAYAESMKEIAFGSRK